MTNLELSRHNPRLLELEAEYAKLNLFEQSLWKSWAKGIDITKFRGENAYIAQMWLMNEQRYQNSYDYLVSIGEGEALVKLGEDDAFGCVTFERDGVKFSRDLIDSVLELRFLRETLGWVEKSIPVVLDIGAGYGRFAHRFCQMFPKGRIICADAVPLSTFLCEYYLRYRFPNGSPHWDIVGLDRLQSVSQLELGIQVATNMQSFSETPLSAVNFWLDLCADQNIKYLFLEPHSGNLQDAHLVTSEPDGSVGNYGPALTAHGYREIRRQHKFPVEMTPAVIYNTEFIMYERA